MTEVITRRPKTKKVKGLGIDKGWFVKSVGKAVTESGSVRAKTWYLGKVSDGAEAANLKVAQLKADWKALKTAGALVWDKTPPYMVEAEAVDAAGNASAGADAAETPAASSETAAPIAPKAGTVAEAATIYLAEIQQRAASNQVTQSHARGQKYHLNRAVSFIGDTLPLTAVDDVRLTAAVLQLCQRPLAKPAPGVKTPTERLSIKSAKSYLSALKWFLNWAAETDRWQKPKRFDRIFKNNKPVMLPEERQQQLEQHKEGGIEPDKFSVEELAPLYAHANGFQRTLMLLALNCGLANTEISELKRKECHLDDAKPWIGRFRGKTVRNGVEYPVYAEWRLWAETVEHLKKYTNAEGDLMLTSAGGKTLVEEGENTRRDAIRSIWRILYRDRVPEAVRPRFLSFKYLRKTGGHLIRTVVGPNGRGYGKEIADMHLSHADEGQITAYAGRPWETLADATTDLRKHLEPMFQAAAAKVTKERKRAAKAKEEAVAV